MRPRSSCVLILTSVLFVSNISDLVDAVYNLQPEYEVRIFGGIKCGACRVMLEEAGNALDNAYDKIVPDERKNQPSLGQKITSALRARADKDMEKVCKYLNDNYFYTKRGQEIIRTSINTNFRDPSIGERIAFSDMENGDRIFSKDKELIDRFAWNDTTSVFCDQYRHGVFTDVCDMVIDSDKFDTALKKGRYRLNRDEHKALCDSLGLCKEPRPLGKMTLADPSKGGASLTTLQLQVDERRKASTAKRKVERELRRRARAKELGEDYDEDDEEENAIFDTGNELGPGGDAEAEAEEEIKNDPMLRLQEAMKRDSGEL